MKALLSTTVLAVTLAAVGCAASTSNTGDGDKTQVDVNDPSALKGATDVEGTLPVGSAVTIGYEHKAEYTSIPYLAVSVVPGTDDTTPAGNTQTITVTGAFPGTPEVYVVDNNFTLISATSNAVVNADGTSAKAVGKLANQTGMGYSPDVGFGLINAQAALAKLLGK